MSEQRTVQRTVAKSAIAIGVLLLGIGLAPGVASAHHPLVSGTTQCRTSDTWSVTWTARADEGRDLTWQITSPGGYAPSGSQADELPFTRTASYTGATATETVNASWSNGATGSATANVPRPDLCVVEPTTTTTTTAPPVVTTTTQPVVVTTTTAPGPTTTVEQAGPTTTVVGQAGPTSTVNQSSGAVTTTVPVGGSLPATGAGGDSASLTVVALMLIGIGAVVLRLASKPTR
jgi:hypothetical protein